jgi:hypothetical protein
VARHVVLVLIAWHMWHEKRLVALWSALCALVGLVGAGLMLGQALHFGLGERLALYPLPMWMAVTGMAVLMGLARRTVFRNVEFSLRTFRPRTATSRPGRSAVTVPRCSIEWQPRTLGVDSAEPRA